MKILVVPTIRENCIKDFLSSWGKTWDKIIIVEDNSHITFDVDVDYHYSWEDIDNDLGKDAWIISRKDSAVRSYGFLKAYEMGADYCFTLDDDTVQADNLHCEKHIANMEQFPIWISSVPGIHVRGLPYKNRGILKNVMASIGLWKGVPDLDAIQTLANGVIDNFEPVVFNSIVPHGQYVPMCGMNLAFKRQVTPLFYFALMGQNQLYRRFDDIWCGVITQKIFDHLGYHMSYGEPIVHHIRASNPFTNLVKEAPGIEFNEIFWEFVDRITLKGDTPRKCMIEVAKSFQKSDNDYLKKFGKAMEIWTKLF